MDASLHHQIDPELARHALAFMAPLMERAVSDSAIGQSGVLYVVVMHPGRPAGRFKFEDAILYEEAYGKPRNEWDADYADYARKKARVSWSSGARSGDPHTVPRWLDLGQATALPGGMVVEDTVVAASGANPVYDEVLAGAVALSLRAAIRLRAEAAS